MSDLLKKIKGIFIVSGAENATQEATPTTTTPTPPTVAPAAPRPVAASPTNTPTSGGAINEKFTNILFAALESGNLEGFDYLEFKQSLLSLSKMNMDEATRMKSAFAMAQTMGVTAPKLVDSATHYLNLLAQEQQKFQTALANQRTGQIGNREEQFKTLQNDIKNKEAQIAELSKSIETNKQEMMALKQEIDQAAVKVESTKNDFNASYQHVVGQIQADVDMMKKYL